MHYGFIMVIYDDSTNLNLRLHYSLTNCVFRSSMRKKSLIIVYYEHEANEDVFILHVLQGLRAVYASKSKVHATFIR